MFYMWSADWPGSISSDILVCVRGDHYYHCDLHGYCLILYLVRRPLWLSHRPRALAEGWSGNSYAITTWLATRCEALRGDPRTILCGKSGRRSFYQWSPPGIETIKYSHNDHTDTTHTGHTVWPINADPDWFECGRVWLAVLVVPHSQGTVEHHWARFFFFERVTRHQATKTFFKIGNL